MQRRRISKFDEDDRLRILLYDKGDQPAVTWLDYYGSTRNGYVIFNRGTYSMKMRYAHHTDDDPIELSLDMITADLQMGDFCLLFKRGDFKRCRVSDGTYVIYTHRPEIHRYL